MTVIIIIKYDLHNKARTIWKFLSDVFFIPQTSVQL